MSPRHITYTFSYLLYPTLPLFCDTSSFCFSPILYAHRYSYWGLSRISLPALPPPMSASTRIFQFCICFSVRLFEQFERSNIFILPSRYVRAEWPSRNVRAPGAVYYTSGIYLHALLDKSFLCSYFYCDIDTTSWREAAKHIFLRFRAFLSRLWLITFHYRPQFYDR